MLASETGMKACTETGEVKSNSAASKGSVMDSFPSDFDGYSGPKARHRTMPPRMTARTFLIWQNVSCIAFLWKNGANLHKK